MKTQKAFNIPCYTKSYQIWETFGNEKIFRIGSLTEIQAKEIGKILGKNHYMTSTNLEETSVYVFERDF